jgi:hypothetical protein
LARKLAYDTKEPEVEEPVVDSDEIFQRKLLAQKLEYDAKVVEEEAQAKEAAPVEEPEDVATEPEQAVTEPEEEPQAKVEEQFNQTKQPLKPDDESRVATKYAAIADVGERAFSILQDLGLFKRND